MERLDQSPTKEQMKPKVGRCEYCKKDKELAGTVGGLPICYSCRNELREIYGHGV